MLRYQDPTDNVLIPSTDRLTCQNICLHKFLQSMVNIFRKRENFCSEISTRCLPINVTISRDSQPLELEEGSDSPHSE